MNSRQETAMLTLTVASMTKLASVISIQVMPTEVIVRFGTASGAPGGAECNGAEPQFRDIDLLNPSDAEYEAAGDWTAFVPFSYGDKGDGIPPVPPESEVKMASVETPAHLDVPRRRCPKEVSGDIIACSTDHERPIYQLAASIQSTEASK